MELYQNVEEKEKELIKYLKENPTATYRQIRKDTKIKAERIYPKNSVRQAYIKANIPFSKSLRKRTRKQMFEEIIKFIKNNPLANTVNIKKELGIDVQKTFGTIKAAYKVAGRVYKPKINIVGSAIPEIRSRAIKFEDEVINILKNKGKIKRKVKIAGSKREADALFYYKNKTYVIEIKNYIKKKITFSEIKQTLNYMKDLNCKKGLIIHSYSKNKIDKINIGNNIITIIPFNKLIEKNSQIMGT